MQSVIYDSDSEIKIINKNLSEIIDHKYKKYLEQGYSSISAVKKILNEYNIKD